MPDKRKRDTTESDGEVEGNGDQTNLPPSYPRLDSLHNFKRRTGVNDDVVATDYLFRAKRNARLAADEWQKDQANGQSSSAAGTGTDEQEGATAVPRPASEEARLAAQRVYNQKYPRHRYDNNAHEKALRILLMKLHRIPDMGRTTNGGKPKKTREYEEIVKSTKDLLRHSRALKVCLLELVKIFSKRETQYRVLFERFKDRWGVRPYELLALGRQPHVLDTTKIRQAYKQDLVEFDKVFPREALHLRSGIEVDEEDQGEGSETEWLTEGDDE